MDKENKVNHSGYEIEDVGQVQIADEVIAVIAGLAATEVDGVQQMSGNITNEIVSKLGMKNLSKGVKVSIDGEQVDVDLDLISPVWRQYSEDFQGSAGEGEGCH